MSSLEEFDVILGCIYRSPNSKTEDVRLIIENIKEMASVRNSELIVVDDFIFKDTDWVTYSSSKSLSHPEFKFVENIKDLFLLQHVNEPTRYRETIYRHA